MADLVSALKAGVGALHYRIDHGDSQGAEDDQQWLDEAGVLTYLVHLIEDEVTVGGTPLLDLLHGVMEAWLDPPVQLQEGKDGSD